MLIVHVYHHNVLYIGTTNIIYYLYIYIYIHHYTIIYICYFHSFLQNQLMRAELNFFSAPKERRELPSEETSSKATMKLKKHNSRL